MIRVLETALYAILFLSLAVAITVILFMAIGIQWSDFR